MKVMTRGSPLSTSLPFLILLCTLAEGLLSRNLDTADSLNALLSDFTLEVPLDDVSGSSDGVTYSMSAPLTCTGFRVESMDFSGDSTPSRLVVGNSSYESLQATFAVSEIEFRCETRLRWSYLIFSGNDDVTVTPDTVSLSPSITFASTDLDRLVPSLAVDTSGTCSDFLEMDIQIQIDTGNGVVNSVVNTILDSALGDDLFVAALCPAIQGALVEVTSLVSSPEIANLAGSRPAPSLVAAGISARNNEAELSSELSDLNENARLWTSARQDSVFETLEERFMDSPYVSKALDALSELSSRYNALSVEDLETGEGTNFTLFVESLENMFEAVFSLDVDIPEETVITLAQSSAFQTLLTTLTDAEARDALVELANALLENFNSLFDLFGDQIFGDTSDEYEYSGFPDFDNETDSSDGDSATGGVNLDQILEFLISLEVTLRDVLEANGISADEPGIDVILELFPGILDVPIGELVSDLEATVLNALGQAEGSLADITTTVSAALDVITNTLDDITELLQDGVNLTDSSEIPDVVLDVLSVVPGLGSTVDSLRNLTWGDVVNQYLTVRVDLGALGAISFQLADLALAGNLEFKDSALSGWVTDSSYVPQELILSDFGAAIGIQISLEDSNGITLIEDTLDFSVGLDYRSEVALTFGMDLALANDFSFHRMKNFSDFLVVPLQAASCMMSTYYVALAGDRTSTGFSASFSSRTGDFSGFLEDTFSFLLNLYTPFIPTILESVYSNLFDQSESFWVTLDDIGVSLNSACRVNSYAAFQREQREQNQGGSGGGSSSLNFGETDIGVLIGGIAGAFVVVGLIAFGASRINTVVDSGAEQSEGEIKNLEKGNVAEAELDPLQALKLKYMQQQEVSL